MNANVAEKHETLPETAQNTIESDKLKHNRIR